MSSRDVDDQRHDDEPVPEEIVLPLEDFIDLHPFRPKDVRSVVESYLEEAVAAGFTEVRLIHGRGIGVQREIVRSLLSRHPAVRDFRDAPVERGGWGATVVHLGSPRGGAPRDGDEGGAGDEGAD
jgi:dsDNA-specific endonuclease/ATPase MutS2